MKRMIWSIKGFYKRGGGRLYRIYAPTICATDYKEPPLVIEIDDTDDNQHGAGWNVQDD